MSPRQQPVQQPPPVQRVRIRYAKRGRMRFTSHRDFSRAFERALVRARVPMAYSSGFNPHPRISYAGAAPTGAASEAEYVELALARVTDPERIRAEVDEALPDGLDLLEAVVSAGGSLPDRLEASVWRLRLPGTSTGRLVEAVERFHGLPEVLVSRMTKKGMRELDARAAVITLCVDDEGSEEECAILHMVLRHGTPSVRPDDVLAGLREKAGLDVPTAPVAQREAQGPFDSQSGTVGDPLAPDRDAAGQSR